MTLQDQVNLLRRQEAPLPLTEGQALAQGMRLRRRGMTYGTIREVVGVYHGVYHHEEWWRRNLRERGAPPRHYANGTLRVPPHEIRERAS